MFNTSQLPKKDRAELHYVSEGSLLGETSIASYQVSYFIKGQSENLRFSMILDETSRIIKKNIRVHEHIPLTLVETAIASSLF